MKKDPTLVLFDLNDFLPYRLSALTNRVSRNFAALYSDRFDLSVPEWRVMAVLGQEAGLCADEVCARTEMDKVTVSRAVARLRQNGRIRRTIASVDRRRSVLELSARGRRVYERIIPLARGYESRLAADLSIAERKWLLDLLSRLNVDPPDPNQTRLRR
ncbi:MAG: winged helix-turn-helix transcriptional regulator [Gammaproteobacteria bacterium]|nr:winged helix-turn-helix transcriptional regulator [Gammaproteobacteria bacterium]